MTGWAASLADLSGWGAAVGLLAFYTWRVTSGGLVPRSTHREAVTDRETERDRWRAAAELHAKTVHELTSQLGDLRAVSRVSVATMRAIGGNAENEGQS